MMERVWVGNLRTEGESFLEASPRAMDLGLLDHEVRGGDTSVREYMRHKED